MEARVSQKQVITSNQWNIILDSHLIIYRITDEQIEVLDIVHSATSMRKIKKTRNIHIE